jgi:septal ring factor EnvC (AmiA/AmiB activator)
MALASGIQAIGESADAFKNMKAVAVNAFNAIKGAIGATGIGLLVIALGTIYAYWDDIKGAVSGVSAEQKKLNKSTEDNLKTQKSKLDSINAQDATLKLQGKSEREILKIKQAATKDVFIAAKQQLENTIATTDAQIKASKRNKEILRGTLEFLTAPLALLLETIDSVGSALGKDFGLKEGLYEGVAKMVFNPAEVEAEGKKTIDELKQGLTVLQNTMDSYELQKKEIDKKANDEANNKRAEQQKKQDEKAKEKADKSKELLAQQLKEQEELLADSEVKKENLRNERAKTS